MQKQLVTAKHKGICAVRSDQRCRSHVFNKRGSSWETAMRKVSEYERQAAECRKLAAQMKTLEQRKQLEDAAEMWDKLARERRVGIVENKHDQA
jgi:hypothetical protein